MLLAGCGFPTWSSSILRGTSSGALNLHEAEGGAQQLLGAQNASALAHNFLRVGFNVVLADVVTPRTLTEYRTLLPAVMVIRLRTSRTEAWRRARTRTLHLTDEEFEHLHQDQESSGLAVDHDLEVSELDLEDQVGAVRRLWMEPSSP